MPQSQSGTWTVDELGTPHVEGPDYVALVIEWDDELDEMTAEPVEAPVELRPRLSQRTHRLRNTALACGAAGVLALVAWRLRRRRLA